MDGADLGAHARLMHELHDGLDRAGRQCRDILTKINGQIGDSAKLVGCQRTARHGLKNFVGQCLHPDLPVGIGLFGKNGIELLVVLVVTHPERAVFSHDRIDRPHAGNVIAPASRATCHRDDLKPRTLEALQGGVGRRSELPV